MAIEFANKPIKWTNEGTAPSEDLKTNGFQAGYKPPAAVFNKQWHTTGECIEELQTKLSGVDDKKVDKADGKSLIDESIANALSLDGNYIKSNKGINVSDGNIYVSDVNGDVVLLKLDEQLQQTEMHFLSEKANESSVANRFSNLPIKSLKGQRVKPTSSTSVTAKEGATIIGDLRARTFGSSGNVTGGNVASHNYSVAMGSSNTASGNISIAIGNSNTASGNLSIAIGNGNTASNNYSTAIGGYNNTASGSTSTAMGANNTASGNYSVAMGSSNTASGKHSVAMGANNTALECQTKIGRAAKDGTGGSFTSITGDAFIIGNGIIDTTFNKITTASNAFRVAYDGSVYGLAAYSSSGADYAELFEWKDGNPDNEDRRGMLVTLDGEKIRLATADDDYILGVVSANPCIEGDVYSDDWQGKYLTDVFGQRLTQTVHIPARYEEQEVTDPETGETTTENVLIEDEHDAVQWVLNPDYDPEQEYVSREDRKEWSAIGLMGKLVVVDDGTCEVNGYCRARVNGIATKSRDIEGLPTNDGYRVMARIDDTHIRVLVR